MQQFINNFSATLAAGINETTTAVSLDRALPALSAGDYFLVTLFDKVGAQESNLEIVKVTDTGLAGGSAITVVRGQEGTTAHTFIAGTKVEMRLTAGSIVVVNDAAISSTQTWSSSKINTVMQAQQIAIDEAIINLNTQVNNTLNASIALIYAGL